MNTSGLHLFVFFTLCPGRIAGPTMTLNGSKCTVSARRAKGKFWGREYAFLAIFAKFSNDNTSGSSNLIAIKILTQTSSHKGDCVVVQCYQIKIQYGGNRHFEISYKAITPLIFRGFALNLIQGLKKDPEARSAIKYNSTKFTKHVQITTVIIYIQNSHNTQTITQLI